MRTKFGIVAKASLCLVSNLALLMLFTVPAHSDPAPSASVVVYGNSDPWLAGMPNGSTASDGGILPWPVLLLINPEASPFGLGKRLVVRNLASVIQQESP